MKSSRNFTNSPVRIGVRLGVIGVIKFLWGTFHQKRPPVLFLYYFFLLIPARPMIPRPKRSMVVGSGTVEGGSTT